MLRSSRLQAALLAAVSQVAVVLFSAGAAYPHPSADARLQTVDRQLEDAPSANLYVEHGKANLQAARWLEALADADRAAAIDPTSTAPWLLRAEVHYASGKVDKALLAADTYLALEPRSAAGRHLRARILREIGRLDEAALEYDRFLSAVRQPLPDHYIERADVLAAQGRFDAAVRGLDQGMERLGSVATLQLAAVDLDVRAGNPLAAVARLDRMLERTPRQVFWMVRRAEILLGGGKYEAAREAFATARAALPPSPRAKALRAVEERIDSGLKALDNVAQTGAEPPIEVVQSGGRR